MKTKIFVVVSYDIPDDKRRTNVAKLMLRFGDRVQFSVFECNVEEKEFLIMLKKLEKAVFPKEDSVRIYVLCKECVSRIRIIGIGKVQEDPDLVIV